MPSVSKEKSGAWESQDSYMKKCVPIFIKEGKPHDQSVAACLNMYKNKWQDPKEHKSKASLDGNDFNNNMKDKTIDKDKLPNPIKANRPVAPEESGAKYDIDMVPSNDNNGCASEFRDGEYKYNLDIRESKVSLVDWSKRPLELKPDGRQNTVHTLNRASARYASKSESKTLCDSCGCTMSANKYDSEHPEDNKSEYPSKSNHFHIGIKHPVTGEYKTIHACSMGCLASLTHDLANEHKEFLQRELAKHNELEESHSAQKNSKSGIDKVPSPMDKDKSVSGDQTTSDSVASMTEKEKRQHHHNNKPYGDVTYADPVNHKYPINTESHVRSAISYINHPKNAAEYSASELAAIKSRIYHAAKKFGIKVSGEK